MHVPTPERGWNPLYVRQRGRLLYASKYYLSSTFRTLIDYRQQRDRHLRGYLREVLSSSTFDYYPGFDNYNWVDTWGEPGELILDDFEPEHDDNGMYFALTRLVSLQNLSYQFSVVNADKHSY